MLFDPTINSGQVIRHYFGNPFSETLIVPIGYLKVTLDKSWLASSPIVP
jgi:hypothetical protein